VSVVSGPLSVGEKQRTGVEVGGQKTEDGKKQTAGSWQYHYARKARQARKARKDTRPRYLITFLAFPAFPAFLALPPLTGYHTGGHGAYLLPSTGKTLTNLGG
jgi:hypothetical protein